MRFCERHSTWDLESLRSASLREGPEIYAPVFENHAPEMRVREREHVSTRAHVEPVNEIRTIGDHEPPQVDARGRWHNWWGQRRNSISTVTHRALSARGTTPEADARAIRLLKENLSPTQRDQYEKSGYFHVIGGTTGKRYRIRNGCQMNVEELNKNDRCVRVLCFMPRGGLVVGDVMLAQKLALELFESHALTVANKIPTRYFRLDGMPL